MDDYCGTFCNSYWTMRNNATANSSHGNAERLACSKLSIQPVWPNCGESRRIIYRWTMTRCHVLCATTIVSTFWEKFKANAIATSKCDMLPFQVNVRKTPRISLTNLIFCIPFSPYRFLRNPTELKSIKNISLLRQQPPPAPSSSNQTLNNSKAAQQEPTHSSSNGTSNGNAAQQLGAHLSVQSLLHQQQQPPPSSPRVHALNGAFHYLSTATNVPDRSSPPQSHSSSQSDMDDQPTDLSTSGRTSNPDCYP